MEDQYFYKNIAGILIIICLTWFIILDDGLKESIINKIKFKRSYSYHVYFELEENNTILRGSVIYTFPWKIKNSDQYFSFYKVFKNTLIQENKRIFSNNASFNIKSFSLID